MYRSLLPRIYEIRDLLRKPDSPSTYFRNFDVSLAENAVKKKHFVDIENDLQKLDAGAWSFLKHEVAPLLEQRSQARGWQSAFDKLNQAKAYHYLVKIGCSDVRFVPASKKKREKTPDLKGTMGSTIVLCEVKTINISNDEAKARSTSNIVRSVTARLPENFFNKLTSTLETAKRQMDHYAPNGNVRRIAYVVINFDDGLHEYVEHYDEQLRSFVATSSFLGLEIVLDRKPAFYSAKA